MVFEKRLAKLSSGFNINLYMENDDKLSIFLYNKTPINKLLDVSNEKYKIEDVKPLVHSNKVMKLSNNLYLCKNKESIYLVNNYGG